MPDFENPAAVVYLEPGTVRYPLRLSFAAASAAGANDGSLPYGTTLSSATVTARDALGTDQSTYLVEPGSVVVGADYVDVELNYSSTPAVGTYALDVDLTLSSGSVLSFEARRIKLGPRSYR